MKHQPPPAQATSGPGAIPAADPTFADLAADPEIAALLDFKPVPRRNKKQGGWSAEMQRMFIARLARHGSPGKACDELGMYRSGVDKVFKSAGAEEFRSAWAAAVVLAERRQMERIGAGQASTADLQMPFLDNRRGRGGSGGHGAPPLPGQMLNEYGQYEDEASIARRAEDAAESIASKLLRSRRLYLAEISSRPAHRAAFEILTELPIDWAKAAKLEPQADEPWRPPNMHEPDMVLTAESGWIDGLGYGPDKKAQLIAELNAYLVEQGMDPVDWGESTERSDADE